MVWSVGYPIDDQQAVDGQQLLVLTFDQGHRPQVCHFDMDHSNQVILDYLLVDRLHPNSRNTITLIIVALSSLVCPAC